MANYKEITTPQITAAQQYAQETAPVYQAGNNASTVTHYGQGSLSYDPITGSISRTLNGNTWQVNRGDAKYQSIYDEYVNRYGAPISHSQSISVSTPSMGSTPSYTPSTPDTSDLERQISDLTAQINQLQYTPVPVEEKLQDTMTYDEALELMRRALEPQYRAQYDATGVAAAQNMERAGLYDSLYGQNLMASAQRDVLADMEAAIGEGALNLQQMDYDNALALVDRLQEENQFGFNAEMGRLGESARISIDYLNAMVDKAARENNMALEALSLELQREAQALENEYMRGNITAQELENKLLALEMQAAEADWNYSSSSSGSSGSSGSSSSVYEVSPQPSNSVTEAPTDADGNPQWIYVRGIGRVTPSELERMLANKEVAYTANNGNYNYYAV